MTATSSDAHMLRRFDARNPLPSATSWVRQLAPKESSTTRHFCSEETWADAVERLGAAPALWVVEICGELAELSANLDRRVGPRRTEAVNALRPTCDAVVLYALIALDGEQPVPVTVLRETLEQLRAAFVSVCALSPGSSTVNISLTRDSATRSSMSSARGPP